MREYRNFALPPEKVNNDVLGLISKAFEEIIKDNLHHLLRNVRSRQKAEKYACHCWYTENSIDGRKDTEWVVELSEYSWNRKLDASFSGTYLSYRNHFGRKTPPRLRLLFNRIIIFDFDIKDTDQIINIADKISIEFAKEYLNFLFRLGQEGSIRMPVIRAYDIQWGQHTARAVHEKYRLERLKREGTEVDLP